MADRADLRARAFDAFRAGVAAADPASAVARGLSAHPLPDTRGRRYIVAVGKAARAMAQAALDAIGPVDACIVVTNYENAAPLDGAEVMAAGHPVPDESGLAAGQAVLRLLDRADADDLVVALVSGGASALLPAPAPGLTLADKAAVNSALLASGLDITDMNLVRQNLSELKGGGFLRHAAPARVASYILSDVLGDDLRVIGSGPTVGPIGPPAAARALLEAKGLWAGLSPQVQAVLGREAPPAPPEAEAWLVGSNGQSLAAMAGAVGADISDGDLVGDVQAAAERIVAEARDLAPGSALAFGGETTVRLTGTGRGGRNQELALRVARSARTAGLAGPWVFLSGGTDGRDGPTDAAGGIVDDGTLDRIAAAGLDLEAILADNDAYRALEASGDLLMTGPTGTNVADLQIFLRGDG
ncbi:DUF4147 domain-containing protein [Rhodobacterales bacterium HKCCE3408]|nr:DUF4147 domain-containing protein [Rhodobacterales bacterium HKCCE3408]